MFYEKIYPVKRRFIEMCVNHGIELQYGADWSHPIGYTHPKGRPMNPELLERMQKGRISKEEYDCVVKHLKEEKSKAP